MRHLGLAAGSGLVVALLAGVTAARPGDEPPACVPPAKAAVAPLAPLLPAELVAALQAGRYAEAAETLGKLAEAKDVTREDRAYYALVRGTALRLAGQLDAARDVLQAASDAQTEGPWAAKLRGARIAVELAARRFADAETIARAEAERLLGGDRKDRLAAVYEDFARRLLEPTEPTTSADPEGAYALLNQARALAQGAALRARLLLAMGRSSLKAGNPGRAIENFTTYTKEYPESHDRFQARFLLGEAQLTAGQALPARLTWTDLARDLEKVDEKAAQELRGRAYFQISRTYGFPSPGDDTSLNLGVAALRRLLEADPAHPLAVQAAYDIAAANQARGRSEAALAAFRRFLAGDGFQASGDEARRTLAQLQMSAQFQVGQILQGQEKFDEAIAAWQQYLAKYPNGPQSADAQRAIVDTQLLIAQDHLRRKEYDKARAAWQTFVAQNPLDGRVPQVLFDIGASFAAEKKYDEGIAAWETLAGKFPGSEPAAHAQFEIASVLETEKGRLSEAVERFKQINVEPWASQARQRIAVMEAKALVVVTPRTFRTGETPHLKISTRNLEKLTFTAYKLDAEAYFRKKNAVSNVESLDIGLVQPDAEWTADVPGFEKYKPVETTYDLPKLDVPGVYVVKVSDEKTLQATTLVLDSDVDAIVKASRDQLLVFAQDMKTGKGRAGARVLVSDGQRILFEGRTGDDGVLLEKWTTPASPGAATPPVPLPCGEAVPEPEPEDRPAVQLPPGTGLTYLVLDGGHVAGSGLGLPGQVAQGLSPRAYLYTDRPAYRPGDTVALRGVVREVRDGQYANPAGAAYKLEIYDSRGRQFMARSVTLGDFGTFALTVPLDSGAPVGDYRVRLYQPGRSEFGGGFQVQAYQLQKIDLAFDLPRTVYFRGETIEGKVAARYQYGTPLAGHDIEVVLPDGRTLSGKTRDDGTFAFEFPTEGFAEEQALSLAARLPSDDVAAAVAVRLAVRAFDITLSTTRDVYLDGESFPLQVTTRDAVGEPVGQALTVRVLKRIEQAGRLVEREVSSHDMTTDAKTGEASVPIRVVDADGGSYVLRAAGTDRFGNPVVADRVLTISGKKDEQKLRLLADRLIFKVGETAEVNLHSRLGAGVTLLTWEADRILQYRIVPVQEGANKLTWPVESGQFPNFTLAAARMEGSEFHRAEINLRVERDLRVTLKPAKPSVGPGEEVEVEVTTVDQLGKPVSAELSLALVDEALLRLYGDALPPIGRFFYDQTRIGAFATESSNTFRYAPATQPVAEALVEDIEQQIAMMGDEADRKDALSRLGVVAEAGTRYYRDLAGQAPAPGMGGGGMMGGYGGAMMARGGRPQSGAMEPAGAAAFNGAEANAPADARRLAESTEEFQSLGRPMAAAKRARRYESLGGRSDREKAGAAEFDESPRAQFVETAYWNPSITTDKAGKTTVKFTAPTALSRYRFTARGTTGAETLVGQANAELAVQKDFFVDLRRPAVLTEGDAPRFTAQLHHRGVRGTAQVVLTVYAAGQEKRYPRTIELKEDGVEEILFEPLTVPAGDILRLNLEARVGDTRDAITTRVPIRPWGVQAFATAAGTANDDQTVFVGLPEGRPYESPEMLIVLAPSLRRLVVELALGRDAYILDPRLERCILPPIPSTTADRASELLAAAAALQYVRGIGGAEAPEAVRLTERVRAGVGELVTLQNDDGGWPWVPPAAPGQQLPSERHASAMALWALAEAERLGLMTDASLLDRAANYLTAAYAQSDAADHVTRSAILHALSTRGKASFEQVNALSRLKQDLPDAALAYLALTFANLNRRELGGEVLGVLGPRAKSEPVAPGLPPRRYWSGGGRGPSRTAVETTALAALAYARVAPDDPLRDGAIAWLLAHRMGTGWQPPVVRGPAVAALAAAYGRDGAADNRYRLVVTVNDKEVKTLDVQGSVEGSAIRVPLEHIKPGAPNRVHFDIEGRGMYGYAVTLTGFTRDFGPEQDPNNRPFGIHRRVYWAPKPTLDGKPLPSGFGVAINPQTYENAITQVARGGRFTVSVEAWRNQPAGQPEWERDFLVLEETLPAGTSLVEGSVNSQASFHEYADGVLRLYFAPDQWPGCTYEVFGSLTGAYRALPPVLRSAYDPGRRHLGAPGDLTVLAPGEKSTDPYKATPDELYARGKGLFDSGRLAEAAGPLEQLWTSFTLRDDVAKDAARMLLTVNIKNYDPRRVVQYFEVLKEKSPELVIPFDDIKVVGRAYAEIGEHERAYLVWRATAEASYLEDARVGEVLRQRGETLEGLALLLELWRAYPDTASIQNDFFGLASLLGNLAGRAINDSPVRRELARAEVTRTDLLTQQVRLIQAFLALSPSAPVADEASLALVGAFLDLEDYARVVALAERYAGLYPRSTFLDSFQYSEALGHFHLGQYDPAIRLAEKIAASTYKDASGAEQPSPNKWQALYILGQIYDARRQPAKAVEYYRQVTDRFTDAAGAVRALTRQELTLPEVAVVRPGREAAAQAKVGRAEDRPAGLRSVPAQDERNPSDTEADLRLTYRNLAEVELKVYAVDLMRLYLTRRNLDAITGIDLAGIHPLVERTVELGDGQDFAEKVRELNLPLEQEGAYLVMARGENLYASGIVLVTPLELEVLEEPESGRVRVRVLDARTKAFVPKVQVKVIGTANARFLSGETDLRGIFVAEGVRGPVTAVARRGAAQYAFYRGKTYIGQPPEPAAAAPPGAPTADGVISPNSDGLDVNLKQLNTSNQARQLERLQQRYNLPAEAAPGVQVDQAR
jgi:tetratricopeptide (TPR) repeat protein